MDDILKEEPGIRETASILQEGTEALQKAKKAPDSAAVRKISKSILEDIGSQYMEQMESIRMETSTSV